MCRRLLIAGLLACTTVSYSDDVISISEIQRQASIGYNIAQQVLETCVVLYNSNNDFPGSGSLKTAYNSGLIDYVTNGSNCTITTVFSNTANKILSGHYVQLKPRKISGKLSPLNPICLTNTQGSYNLKTPIQPGGTLLIMQGTVLSECIYSG